MQGIYNWIPETNRVSTVYSVADILYLQFLLHVMVLRPWNIFCFLLLLSLLLLLLLFSFFYSCQGLGFSMCAGVVAIFCVVYKGLFFLYGGSEGRFRVCLPQVSAVISRFYYYL
jgi:hypothetical protein